MKVSTKGRYGLRAMLDLALYSEQSHIPLKSIADRQKISEHYLEQLMACLKKAGLVIGIRGSQGGYKLSKDPSQISIGNILRALEGPLAPVECVSDSQTECEKSQVCVPRVVWKRINDSINQAVDSIMLSELVEDYNQKSTQQDFVDMKGDYCNG